MSETVESLSHKIDSAAELGSVVRTMKALAASNIAQYERAVVSLEDYYRAVELGLIACLQRQGAMKVHPVRPKTLCAVVFGSDQGLVGQYNELLADFVAAQLKDNALEKHVFVVGERIQGYLADFEVDANFAVPNSIAAITGITGHILSAIEKGSADQVYLFHNRPKSGSVHEPVMQRMLPLDETWQGELARQKWPSKNLPEVIGEGTLEALIREYLFISLFRACAESLASENAARLNAMRRAEKNIDELLEELNQDFHHLRQTGIDEELFDVIAGYELLSQSGGIKRGA